MKTKTPGEINLPLVKIVLCFILYHVGMYTGTKADLIGDKHCADNNRPRVA